MFPILGVYHAKFAPDLRPIDSWSQNSKELYCRRLFADEPRTFYQVLDLPALSQYSQACFRFHASEPTHKCNGIMPAHPRLPISTINGRGFISMNSIPRCHTIASIESFRLLVSRLLLRSVRNSRLFGLYETPFLNQLASRLSNFLKCFQDLWGPLRCQVAQDTLLESPRILSLCHLLAFVGILLQASSRGEYLSHPWQNGRSCITNQYHISTLNHPRRWHRLHHPPNMCFFHIRQHLLANGKIVLQVFSELLDVLLFAHSINRALISGMGKFIPLHRIISRSSFLLSNGLFRYFVS
jgi:hypothetical protein